MRSPKFLYAVAVLAACNQSTPNADSATTVTQAGRAASPIDPSRASAVAANLVRAALVKPGDRVLITGNVDDVALLEELAIETMKRGGQPLISVTSDRFERRSFDDVPASFDTLPAATAMAVANSFDVQLTVDPNESADALASVPAERRARRAATSVPVVKHRIERRVRTANIGNGLYPTADLAKRLGVSQAELAQAFWEGAMTPPESLRIAASALMSAFASGNEGAITAANGTNLTFRLDGSKTVLSVGALTPEGVQRGGASLSTWLPAGELFAPPLSGTTNGAIVFDRVMFDGTDIKGLKLTFAHGKLTGMMAESGIEALRKRYDAASGDRDKFAMVDVGVNRHVKLPTGTGVIVYMAAGNLTLFVGANQALGGSYESSFTFSASLPGATLTIGGKTLVENGVLK